MNNCPQHGTHKFSIVAMAAFAFVAATASYAQMQPSERYPWDQRPAKCFMPGAEPTGMCAPVDNLPSAERTMRYVSNLFANDTFVLLERYLTEVVASKKRFEDGVYADEIIFSAFVRFMPLIVADGRGARGIAAWRKVVPESRFVVLAEAALLQAAAWNARGSGVAQTVSPEAWEVFAIRLREAEQVLLKAPQQTRDSAPWHIALLSVTLDLKQPETEPLQVFNNAVKRWATYASFYQLMLSRMVPKWGGNWTAVEAFITEATKLQPAGEAHSMYARLYIHLVPEGAVRESAISWDTMRRGLEEATERFPHPKYKNLYASVACLARDKELFGKAMSKIPREQVVPAWWLDGNSYEACIRWVSI